MKWEQGSKISKKQLNILQKIKPLTLRHFVDGQKTIAKTLHVWTDIIAMQIFDVVLVYLRYSILRL